MKRSYHFFVMLGVFFLFQASALSAEIYRWKDKSGRIHYSTSPPSYRVFGVIEVKRNNRWESYSDKNTTFSTHKPIITYTTSSPDEAARSSQPALLPSGQTVVQYHKQDSMIIVDATVNQHLRRPFAIDTGATYTVISPKIAEALLIVPVAPNAPHVTLQTANGRIRVPLINLKSVSIGDLVVPNVMAAVHEFDDTSQISGLLGLNFLNRFQMTVDATKHQLVFRRLDPSSDFTKRDCVAARMAFDRGRILDDDSEQEIAYYKNAISLCPDFIEAYYYLGAIYIHQQHGEEAIALHREILRRQPDEPEAHFRLGVAYMLQRNFQAAQQEFQRALHLDPNHKQAKEYSERLKNQ